LRNINSIVRHPRIETVQEVPMTAYLYEPLTVASGYTISNRIAKAAMEENLAGEGQLPDERIIELYRVWGAGGLGLIVTGNVMVDARALTGPAGIVLDQHTDLRPFSRWAAAAKAHGTKVWMQINHPGRQVYADMPGVALAPSEVKLDIGKQSKRFPKPSAMTEQDILDIIRRMTSTAKLAERAGFDGVEIHAAHGYLLSQFLSPRANRRTDRWGGSLTNRARALIETVNAVRSEVSPGFAVAVKLNAGDFQYGGFDAVDAKAVVRMLNRLPVDLVELSGGTFESPAMQGRTANGIQLGREAYFLSIAEDITTVAEMPIMLTGGVQTQDIAQRVLDSGVAMVGVAQALAYTPDLVNRWRRHQPEPKPIEPVHWKNRTLATAATMARARHQLHRIAAGQQPQPNVGALRALAKDQIRRRAALKRYTTWLPIHNLWDYEGLSR
jgi:2,4-dienoyl-CoA reductase-like NADH-dependent reductase (Old Yellow Enzyme family)